MVWKVWNHHVNGTVFESDLRSSGWPQWNCHVNEITFQSALRSKTDLSSLRVSCKHSLKLSKLCNVKLILKQARSLRGFAWMDAIDNTLEIWSPIIMHFSFWCIWSEDQYYVNAGNDGHSIY